MIGLLLLVNLIWGSIFWITRKSNITILKKVKNKEKHFNAKDYYWLVYFKNKENIKVPYLFIDSELEKARNRALKNMEDIE